MEQTSTASPVSDPTNEGLSVKQAFFTISQFLLLFTASGKVIELTQWSTAGITQDPLIPLFSVRHTLVFAALIEVAVFAFIWKRATSETQRAVSILWLCAVFLAYRLGLSLVGFDGYCSCLGHWRSWLRISEAQVDAIALGILSFLLIGSLAVLVKVKFFQVSEGAT